MFFVGKLHIRAIDSRGRGPDVEDIGNENGNKTSNNRH